MIPDRNDANSGQYLGPGGGAKRKLQETKDYPWHELKIPA